MSKSQRRLKWIILCTNLLLAILEAVGIVLMTELYIKHNLPPLGWLQYYTQLSNIFSMAVALITAAFSARALLKNTDSVPPVVRLLKFSAACCLAETFLVTVFVLSPMGMMGGFVPLMLQGPNLYHHLLCPLLCVLSLLILEKGEKLTLKHCVYSMIPTFIYAVVSVTFNILKLWHGPYPFLYVYEQPIYMSMLWAVTILGGAFVITLGLKTLANLHLKNKKEK